VRIYVFKSEGSSLRAFTDDRAGSKLPQQFRPWRAVGAIGHDKDPPHSLPRDEIERAIGAQGFQLWRKKLKTKLKAKAG
jgi:hypothetical protein